MTICIIAEGCYPYVVGGVSSWIDSMIRSFPQYDFCIVAILADRDKRGKFAYDLPENVISVSEVYLNDEDFAPVTKIHKNRTQLQGSERYALNYMLSGDRDRWDDIFDMFAKKPSVNDLLMGPDFLDAVKRVYDRGHTDAVFTDFLWTMRSMYLPLFFTLETDIPKADLYHCAATGYSGVIGAMAKHFYHKPLLISEHGIYTREREEELIRAQWVKGEYKDIWIAQFRKMSTLAYNRADLVTSLYGHARQLQLELGCPKEKTLVTPNGIDPSRYQDIPGKPPEDEGYTVFGAIIRVAPIKDVITLIRAFSIAKKKASDIKLYICGPWEEEEEYAKSIFDMVDNMGLGDVVFTGRIRTPDYIGRMDCLVLTSISEGQPLTILEGYAAKKPSIATDVGNCRGLIEGESDSFGKAGIVTHIMHAEETAQAMLEMRNHPILRRQMGENGYKRLMNGYKLTDMQQTYADIYSNFLEESDERRQ